MKVMYLESEEETVVLPKPFSNMIVEERGKKARLSIPNENYLGGNSFYLFDGSNACDVLRRVRMREGEGVKTVQSLQRLALCLFWTYKTGNSVNELAFSEDGHLGVAAGSCAYILDQNGNLVSKYCEIGAMSDVSYCCDKFGFINWNGNAYIYDLINGTWGRIYVGDGYDHAITMLKDGFLAGDYNLAYFKFDGSKKWDMSMNYITNYLGNGPAVYKEYVYVPRYGWFHWGEGALTILKLSNGSEVKSILFNENVWDAQVCGKYLALGTAHHVILYDISDPTNPRLLWGFGGMATRCNGVGCGGARNVAFSPDRRYLISTNVEDKKIHIFNIQAGKQVLERLFEDWVISVSWWRDRIAVGLRNGIVYVFKFIKP
ncbi:hypothetical protein IPA_06310 [Ignicoccus pacificus DSM 13166]|uniref:Uncharacterized protein n=1 Tax=Ignicoccus pacificus DSM 13166 TaxID=940294 RepID=A0A977KBD6_9CREN|nr:hypothetical protein IPA_06310 [Ignicoccus pacificus DSM 13166]